MSTTLAPPPVVHSDGDHGRTLCGLVNLDDLPPERVVRHLAAQRKGIDLVTCAKCRRSLRSLADWIGEADRRRWK